MKKILNNPKDFVCDVLKGIYNAHPQQVQYVNDDLHCFTTRKPVKGKVGLVTGGGSGHLPLFLGYVGPGMLDGCAVGGVFQSPNPDQIAAVTQAVDTGAGVIYVYGNYNGDIFNFNMAADIAAMEHDIETRTIVVGDDVASASSNSQKNTRRGIAGMFYIYKCMGASAAKMKNIDEVQAVGELACRNTRTMGVALSPCIVPELGKPSFEVAEDEMEFGMGIHGEPGILRCKMVSAKETAQRMLDPILEDLSLASGDRVSVLINGLGATPLEEQYIVFRHIFERLDSMGITVSKTFVGEFATSMEMAGLSVSVLKLDETLEHLIFAPADAVMYQQV